MVSSSSAFVVAVSLAIIMCVAVTAQPPPPPPPNYGQGYAQNGYAHLPPQGQRAPPPPPPPPQQYQQQQYQQQQYNPAVAQEQQQKHYQYQQSQQVQQEQYGKAVQAQALAQAQAEAEAQAQSQPRRTFAILGNFLKRQLNIVREAFQELGFREVRKDDPEGWSIGWGTGGALKNGEYIKLDPSQRFNHFPCTHELGNKDTLYSNLVRAAAANGPDSGYDFFPLTYILPKDTEALRQAWAAHPEKMFILKPKHLARGEGIRLLESIDDLPTEDVSKFIVQEYLHRPLLVNGKKTTLRMYVGATSIEPLRLYLLQDGFVHMATEQYTNDPEQIGNIRVHVTNPDVQGSAFQSSGGGDNYWNLTRFRNMLDEHPTLDKETVWADIESMLVRTVLAVQDSIGHCVRMYSSPSTSFEVWGFDVFIDEDGKPWIIEVNHTPSTNTDFPAARDIKRWFVKDMISMAYPSVEDIQKWSAAVYHRILKIGWDKHDLPEEAIDMLIQAESEYQNRGHYRRIYPSGRGVKNPYPRYEAIPYLDQLLEKWVETFVVEQDYEKAQKAAK